MFVCDVFFKGLSLEAFDWSGWICLEECILTTGVKCSFIKYNVIKKNRIPSTRTTDQRLMQDIFEIFYFLFCLKSQPYIHKYLITTFNKEYITLQWIQTSTFKNKKKTKQNFTASRHPPLSNGAIAWACMSWRGRGGWVWAGLAALDLSGRGVSWPQQVHCLAKLSAYSRYPDAVSLPAALGSCGPTPPLKMAFRVTHQLQRCHTYRRRFDGERPFPDHWFHAIRICPIDCNAFIGSQFFLRALNN